MSRKYRSLFSLLLLSAIAQAQLINYNWAASIPKSDKYEVRVAFANAYQNVFTHYSIPNGLGDPLEGNSDGVATQWKDRSMSFAIFSFAGTIDIEVKKIYGAPASRVEVSPKNYGINPYYFDGTTVRFRIDNTLKPAYLSVNFITADNQDPDGAGGLDIKHGMMIFADKPESNIPSTTGSGTIVYSNATTYAQMQAADLIYFPPGDWDLHSKITDEHRNKGRFHFKKNNQQIYLAGGAFVRGSLDADGFDNLRLFGRGIITGKDYQWHEVKEPKTTGGPLDDTAWINFTGSNNSTYEGISMIYPCHHTCPSSNNTTIRNIKIIGFAYNHDGIRPNSGSVVEEIFIKTNDDYDYARDPHVVKNSIFWPSRNGASGMLGWNNLGVGKTSYDNMHYIHAEWSTFNRNRGIIGSQLSQGVNIANDTVRNTYAEDFCSILANITIEEDRAQAFDINKPGEIKNFLFKNIILENTFRANNGNIIKQPIRGFSKMVNGVTYKATVHDITFTNVVIGNVLLTNSNKDTYFAIDNNTAYNIFFNTEGAIHNVTATALANGKVSPSGVLPTPEGMRRNVNIIPNPGYKIKNVKVNGVSVGRVQHHVFANVQSNQTIEAEFELGDDYYDFTAVTSINDPLLEKNIIVYPYSSKSYFIANTTGKSIHYTLYNELGQVIIAKQSLENSGTAPLDLERFSAGIYFIYVEQGGSRTVKRISIL